MGTAVNTRAGMLLRRAREIAADVYDGQGDPLYALASTGTLDLPACAASATRSVEAGQVFDVLAAIDDAAEMRVRIFENGEVIDDERGLTVCEAIDAVEDAGCTEFSNWPALWTPRGWYVNPDTVATAIVEGPEWARKVVHTTICKPTTREQVAAVTTKGA